MNGFEINNPAIKDRVVIKNTLAFAFLSHMPIVPGHLLICPLRVVQTCENLTMEEWQAIMDLKRSACLALKKAFDVEGFNFAWNIGENAGQSVPHFHLHVVPRKTGDTGILEYEPRVFLYRPGSRALSPPEELQQTAVLIRNCL
jgi:diadenosine tetraphosphate (Ap4A) HIT family hydrolase